MGKSKEEKNILICEDDPTYLRLWERIIKDHYPCRQFWPLSDPDEAIKILHQHKVDLLISDVVMDKMNGYALAKLARKKNPKIEILLTTGYQTDLSRFNLGELRCHLLHKPYHDLTNVCLLIQHILNGENVFAGMKKDSFSKNIDCPTITEWTL